MGNWVQTDEHNVNATGVLPGLIVIGTPSYSYLDAEQVEILIPYTPPVVTGSVVGAHVWEESPDVSTAPQAPANGTVAMDGAANSGGAWNPVDKGKFLGSPVSLIIPSQKVAFTNRYYLLAYTETAENTLIQANKPGASANVTITIQPAVYQVGVEYAWQVTNCTATVEYDDNQVASPKYAIRFGWTPPAERPAVWMKLFGYCCIVYEYDEAARRAPGPEMGVSQTNTLSLWFDLFPGTSVIRCWFVSEDNSDEPRRNTIIPNVTPYVDVTVQFPIPSRPAAGKYADNVAGFAVSSGGYAKGEDGQRVFKINWTWTKPVGVDALARWGGAVIYSYKPGGQAVARTGPELGSSGVMEFPDLPILSETWTFAAISRDNNANANSDPNSLVSGTPTTTLAVTPAPVDVAPVTGFSVAQPVYGFNGQGVKSLLCVPTFTKPADKAWAYINFYAMVTGDPNRYPLGSPIAGGTEGTAYIQDFPVVNEQWTFRAYSVDVNGRESPTYVSSATYTVGPPPVDVPKVTAFTVTTPYYESNGEGPSYLVIIPNFTKPNDPNWSYMNFYAEIQEEGSQLFWLGSPVVGGLKEAAIVNDFPTVNQNWSFRCYSVDIYGKESPVYFRFPDPSGWITVGPPSNNTPASTSFSVAQRYETNGTGQKTLILVPTFTKPNDVTWAYSNFYKEKRPTTTKDFLSAPAVSGESAKITDYPKANEEWAFYLASVDIYGKEVPLASWVRYPAAGTWTTVGPPTAGPTAGAEWTSNVSWSDFGATPYTDSNGVAMYAMSGWFAEPVPADPTWGGVEFRITDDAGNLIATQSGKTSPLTIQINSPSSSKTHLLYIISFDVNGKLNTIAASTPQRTYVIGNAAGTLDLRKMAAASSLDMYVNPTSGLVEVAVGAITETEIKDDSISTPKLKTLVITSDKIAANAVIAGKILANTVGATEIMAAAITTAKLDTNDILVGGGSGKCGLFKVVDASSNLVAELGRLTTSPPTTTNFGGWFKVFGAGGSNYTTAKVFTDAAGNLTVKDVTFTITNTTTATEVFTEPSMFDSSYGSIVLTVRSTSTAGPRAWHLSKGFVTRMGQDWQTGSLNTMASFDRSGELVLYQPDTRVGQTLTQRISIWANGSDGSIRAQAYNTVSVDGAGNVTVQFGQSGTYTDPTGKTLVFTKGVLTGRTGW